MEKFTEIYACVYCGEDTWGGGVSLLGDNAGTKTMCYQCADEKSEIPSNGTDVEWSDNGGNGFGVAVSHGFTDRDGLVVSIGRATWSVQYWRLRGEKEWRSVK